jgi:hypothetical protein
VKRPKDELISQKNGHRSTLLTKSYRQPPVFDAIRCEISLDKPKVVSPMLPPSKSDILSILNSEVNIVGRIIDDPAILKTVKGAARIKIEKA